MFVSLTEAYYSPGAARPEPLARAAVLRV